MKITRVRLGRLEAPLRVPFKTALRTVDKIRDVAVAVYTDTGAVGYGEAPPTAAITGETEGSLLEALTLHIAPAVLGREVEDLEALTDAVSHSIVRNSSAKAAMDMALWDLYGQRWGLPVQALLGGGRPQLTTDLTISVNPPEQMARDALDAVARGYDTLKLKVGVDPALDTARLLAVRQAVGPKIRLRIDANQAWTAPQAVRILDAMQSRNLDLELVEQPVPAQDLAGLKYVTDRGIVPVLADESVFGPRDAAEVLARHAADLLNIKLMKCGGITGALKIAALAEVYGVECMMGCMLEAKLSVNAAVAVACARRIVTKIDLDGPGLCSADPVRGGAVFDGKTITPCAAPGLGIDGIDPAAITFVKELCAP